MEPIIAPIKTGDTGPRVANLQDALLALLEQKKILQPPGTTVLTTPDELQRIHVARVEVFYGIELIPLRLARVVFPARIARNELRRKLRL